MSKSAAVILAAGHGSRMRSSVPKVLHRLAGKNMLDYVVEAIRGAAIERVIVVVGHGGDEVVRELPPSTEWVRQLEQLGTANAALCACPLLLDDANCDDVFICYGDCPLLTPDVFRDLMARRRETGAVIALTISTATDPQGYGRVIRDADGQVRAIVEEKSASAAEKSVRQINAGVYCFERSWLLDSLPRIEPSPSGEFYLTDLVELATRSRQLVQSIEAPLDVTSGVNDRIQLAAAESVIRDRLRRRLMLSGVTLIDPATTYVDALVTIGEDSIVYPGTLVEGVTAIGRGCKIGPYSRIVDSVVGDRVVVNASVLERAVVGDDVRIGPFSHLRPGARLGANVELGNYAEVKNASIGAGTKMHHFSYIGDAEVGDRVNVGAGTITCNYDGESGQKSMTMVESGASLGSDTLLVAPIRVGKGAITGAGAVVTHDVEPGALVLGVPARPVRRRRGDDAAAGD